MSEAKPASARVTVRRHADRARYGAADIVAILDAGTIAHVGVNTDTGPVVIPMAYGRSDTDLYLHGATGNAALRAAIDQPTAVTVTLLDGLVSARSAFHHSANYRSVVVRGEGRRVDGPEKEEALRRITDHIVPRWDDSRPPNGAELRQTLVVAVPLAEASAKVRTGDPIDDPDDLDGPWWAGVLPRTTGWADPIPSAGLAPGLSVPDAVRNL